MADRTGLFVRIPSAEAEKLDRAAFELKASKQDLVAGLVARHVDPSDLSSLERLLGGRRENVGFHSFQPAAPGEVLTADQLAELLQVELGKVLELAENGELPGRRLGDEWRFSRQAVLEWLAGASANDEGD